MALSLLVLTDFTQSANQTLTYADRRHGAGAAAKRCSGAGAAALE